MVQYQKALEIPNDYLAIDLGRSLGPIGQKVFYVALRCFERVGRTGKVGRNRSAWASRARLASSRVRLLQITTQFRAFSASRGKVFGLRSAADLLAPKFYQGIVHATRNVSLQTWTYLFPLIFAFLGWVHTLRMAGY